MESSNARDKKPSKSVSIYIASWGNPLDWSEVEYNCTERGIRGRGYSSIVCSDADLYVVYMLETAAFVEKRKGAPQEKAAKCAEEAGLRVERIGEGFRMTPPDWGQMRELVRRYGKCVAKALGRDVEVVVTGARGKFAGVSFNATTDLIAAELLSGLWGVVRNKFRDDLDAAAKGELENLNVELHLDITHGVNFMPALALYVAPHLASLLLARGAKQVVIKAYNATPGDWEYVKVFTTMVSHIQFPSEPTTRAARALYRGAVWHFAALCRPEPPQLNITPSYKDGKVEYRADVKYHKFYEQLLAATACEKAPKPPTLKRLMKWYLIDVLPPTTQAIVKDELEDIFIALNSAGASEVRLSGLEQFRHSVPISSCNKKEYRNFLAHAGLLAAHITARRTQDGDWELEVDQATFKCLDVSY